MSKKGNLIFIAILLGIIWFLSLEKDNIIYYESPDNYYGFFIIKVVPNSSFGKLKSPIIIPDNGFIITSDISTLQKWRVDESVDSKKRINMLYAVLHTDGYQYHVGKVSRREEIIFYEEMKDFEEVVKRKKIK